MKFSWKIFFVSFLIIIISFGTGGFLLINSVFSTTLENKIQAACDSNSYITISFYALDSNAETMGYNKPYRNYMINNFINQISSGNPGTTVIIGGIGTVREYGEKDFARSLDNNNRVNRIVKAEGRRYIQAVSRVSLYGNVYFVQTITDIDDIYQSRDSYCRTYQLILMGVALFASTVLFVFSKYVTSPLVKLSAAAGRIADGDFCERAEDSNTKELHELSQSFNTMAQCVEDYIDELKKAAQSRDEFVADFTHELKTPLTSVIGYADMLRSYELDAEQRRKCADYIYKEGKRLETLSANLLNIIVLKNNDITFGVVKTDSLVEDTKNAVEFLLKRYNVNLKTDFESVEVSVEQSLIKTLLYNVIDNACKASQPGQSVILGGFISGKGYTFAIIDSGQGIPKNELEKITRPFYMVDKSRSRSMGGAGLGLSLCSEIARLHGSELKIDSTIGKGTTVTFFVPIYTKGGEKAEHED